MKIDTLSSTLLKTKLNSLVSGALDAGGDWAIQVPPYTGFKLHVVTRGECWLTVEGNPIKYHGKTGDCILQTSGKPFAIAKDQSIKKKLDLRAVIATARDGVMTVSGGGDFFSITANFDFEGHLPKVVFGRLPPIIHVPGHLDQAAILRWTLERFSTEFRTDNEGRTLILNHLAPIMLMQILRYYLANHHSERNWLVALSDPKLSKAIEVMHSDFQKPWSLEDLAKIAGLSRSGFALNFKKQVGIAPMDYLTNVRMHTACELLEEGEQSIGAIANSVGYESESSFSQAFKKVIKCRPGFYKRSRNGSSEETVKTET